MTRFLQTVAFALTLMAGSVQASTPTEVQRGLPSAEAIGATKFSWLLWDLFTATLWTPQGSAFTFSNPFALTLAYSTNFTAEELSKASVDEIARISGKDKDELNSLGETLLGCFADVGEGDRITGLSLNPDQARFFLNGREVCEISSPGFAESFFGIWLGPKTRDDRARQRLLGLR